MQRKIVTIPAPVLRKTAKPVTFNGNSLSKKFKNIVKDLKETAREQKDPESLGLAAPQIGESFRVFIAKVEDEFIAFINPKIVEKSKSLYSQRVAEKERLLEGCLSIPGYYAFIDRPYSVTLRWQDETGKWQERKFSEKEAAYVQHEYDHLNGILFTDLALAQKAKIYKTEKDQEGEETLVEIEWK